MKGVQNIYLCPRHIACHRGHPEKCGRACAAEQAGNRLRYEEVAYVQVVSVKRDIVMNDEVCCGKEDD